MRWSRQYKTVRLPVYENIIALADCQVQTILNSLLRNHAYISQWLCATCMYHLQQQNMRNKQYLLCHASLISTEKQVILINPDRESLGSLSKFGSISNCQIISHLQEDVPADISYLDIWCCLFQLKALCNRITASSYCPVENKYKNYDNLFNNWITILCLRLFTHSLFLSSILHPALILKWKW